MKLKTALIITRFVYYHRLAIEDQLIDDPRNIIYDSHYFELKDLLKYILNCIISEY